VVVCNNYKLIPCELTSTEVSIYGLDDVIQDIRCKLNPLEEEVKILLRNNVVVTAFAKDRAIAYPRFLDIGIGRYWELSKMGHLEFVRFVLNNKGYSDQIVSEILNAFKTNPRGSRGIYKVYEKYSRLFKLELSLA
jgi:hypothetical protein